MRHPIARWISIIGHPFISIVLLVAITSFRLHDAGESLRRTAIVAAAILLPLGLFVRQRHRSGRWSTVDASAPGERPALYLAAFALLLPVALYFLWRQRGDETVRGLTATIGLLGLAALLNRWIKLSLHVAIAAFTGIILWQVAPIAGGLWLAFLLPLGWSRLALARHTANEVVGGGLLGLSVAVAALWF